MLALSVATGDWVGDPTSTRFAAVATHVAGRSRRRVAGRSVERVGAEVGLESATWSVRASRMKSRREHGFCSPVRRLWFVERADGPVGGPGVGGLVFPGLQGRMVGAAVFGGC